MKGDKLLLKQGHIRLIPRLPKVNEIDVRNLWADIRRDDTIQKYFSDSFTKGNRLPERIYMFTVSVNKIFSSLYPDVFDKMVKIIAQNRHLAIPEDEKIMVRPDIINELTTKKSLIFERIIIRRNQSKALRSIEAEIKKENCKH